MSDCPWCGSRMEVDSDGGLSCPYVCQDDCPDCGGVIGDCHENDICTIVGATPDGSVSPGLVEGMSNNTATLATLDRAAVADLRDKVSAAIADVFAEAGLVAPTVTGSFTKTSVSFKLSASIDAVDESGVNLASQEALDYEKFGSTFGLDEGRLGKEFSVQGKRFVFAGINGRRPKYPICGVEVASGRTFKFGRDVAALINAAD